MGSIMCGILGRSWSFDHSGSESDFNQALDLLKKRGPDSFDRYKIAETVEFAHTRLSIRDLSSGSSQPVSHTNFVFVFNGEIYDGLKVDGLGVSDFDSDLLYLTHCFSNIDITNAGALKDFVKLLRGMFAIALYCRKSEKIFLIRDHLGKKPLFYRVSGRKNLTFASTVGSLCAASGIEFDKLEAKDLFMSQNYRMYTNEEFTYGVNSVQPGEIVEFDSNSGSISKSEYFSLLDLIKDENVSDGEITYNHVEKALSNSIARRSNFSDVDVAFVVSGGLDSSLIYKLSAKNVPTQVYFVDVCGNSEIDYVKAVVANSDALFVTKFSSGDHEYWSRKSAEAIELPLSHPNSAALLKMVSSFAQNNTKVVLTGEGADELFGGYSNSKRILFLDMMTRFFLNSKRMNFFLSQFSGFDVMKFFSISPLDRQMTKEEKKVSSFFYSAQSKYAKSGFKRPYYQAFLLTQLRFYLIPLLVRSDRIFMEYGVEARNPFLDLDLINVAVNLSYKHKIKKEVLRKIASKYIDEKVINRKKNGFSLKGML